MNSRLSRALAEFAEGRWPDGDRRPREPRFDSQEVDTRSMEPPLHPSELERFERAGARWVPIRLVRFLMIFCVGVGTTLAWQSYGNAARRMVANLSPALGWLAPPSGPASHAATPAPASPDQVAALSRSLAAVRQSVDKLAVDIGRLQAPKQDPLARTSAPPVSLPPPAAAGSPGRRAAATAQVQR